MLLALVRESARRLSLARPLADREAAYRYWLGVLGRERRARGIELDPKAADECRAALVELTGEPRAAEGIVTADSLFTAWPRTTFVIANPPFLGGGSAVRSVPVTGRSS